MTFKDAQLKLTLWYILIVMVIGAMFSSLVYLVSFHEITIFNHNQSVVLRTPPPRLQQPNFDVDAFENLRQKQLDELKDHMIRNLIVMNLGILILAGLASYYFAKKTLQPIEEMVELQNQFTADASHELRTPLAAMKIETEVALRDKKMNLAEAKKMLQSNLEEISKLETLSNGLLELAQYNDFKNHKSVVKAENAVSSREIISDTVKRFEGIANLKKIKIASKISSVKLKINEEHLSKTVTILLDNAIKYSLEKTIIKINTFVEHKNFVLTVQDQGVGIDPTELNHIFDRFFRSDISRSKNKQDGFGLGLAIAKRIISSYNGSIVATSVIKNGTTFTVKLPLN